MLRRDSCNPDSGQAFQRAREPHPTWQESSKEHVAASLPCSCKNLSLPLFDFADHFHTNTQKREASSLLCSPESNNSGFQEQAVVNREETKSNRTHTLLNSQLGAPSKREIEDIGSQHLVLSLWTLGAALAKCSLVEPNSFISFRWPCSRHNHTGFTLQQTHGRYHSKTDLWGNHKIRIAPSFPKNPHHSPAFSRGRLVKKASTLPQFRAQQNPCDIPTNFSHKQYVTVWQVPCVCAAGTTSGKPMKPPCWRSWKLNLPVVPWLNPTVKESRGRSS